MVQYIITQLQKLSSQNTSRNVQRCPPVEPASMDPHLLPPVHAAAQPADAVAAEDAP